MPMPNVHRTVEFEVLIRVAGDLEGVFEGVEVDTESCYLWVQRRSQPSEK